jgi:hypothetical protein
MSQATGTAAVRAERAREFEPRARPLRWARRRMARECLWARAVREERMARAASGEAPGLKRESRGSMMSRRGEQAEMACAI